MGSPFDALQASADRVITAVVGYEATWTPSNGGPAQTARVLFKDPADDQRLVGVDVSTIAPECQFLVGTFNGLKELAAITKKEQLALGGRTYYVRKVEALNDGRTLRATLARA
jgi:hypothetical protein